MYFTPASPTSDYVFWESTLASWTDTDHSSVVTIVTILCMLYWVAAGILRQTLSFARGNRFSPADWFLSASMVY